MKDLKLQTGDVFCTGNPQSKFVGAGIKFFEILYSKDNKAEFGHSGIILNSKGTTFEALWKVKSQCIYKDYVGQNVIIARPILDLNGNTLVTRDKRSAILEITNKYKGKWYPAWRLGMFMFGPLLPKYIHFLSKPVCSELTACYLAKIGARYKSFWGVMPDTLADEFERWSNYTVIFKGTISDKIM